MIKDELPANWTTVPLKFLLREPLRNGHSAKASNNGSGVPTLTLSAVTYDSFTPENIKLTTADPTKVDDLWLEPDDILIERANTPELVGTAARFPGPQGIAIFPDLMIRARVHRDLNARYVAQFLKSRNAREYFRRRAQGIAGSMPKIDQASVEELVVLLPPRAEQDRIAAALESYLSRLNETSALLERVQRNLKRYRASVLKAAVEGRLVPTEAELARAEKRDYEPASALLKRILTERRQCWEKDGRRGKYMEPAPPDTKDLPELPEGWCWATLQQLCSTITDGDHQPPPQNDSGIPFLVIGNVRNGELSLGNTRYVPRSYFDELDPVRRPQLGDILYTVTGSFGIPVLVRTSEPFCVQRHIAILRPLPSTNAGLLVRFLDSPFLFGQAAKIATGIAQMTVPLQGLRRLAIPLPPAAEQDWIVAELERQLSIIKEQIAAAAEAKNRSSRLRQSILKWAFEGKLVDQDPNDEPASALLARIKSEQSTPNAPKAAPRRRTKTA